jgi:sugar phosphate permease
MAGIAALCLAYVLSQFYRSFLAVLVPYLMQDLAMTRGELAAASAAWFIAFALMQFPIGVWLDNHGPRRTSAWLHALAGGGGALLFAFAVAPWMVIVAMALIGIGCAPVLMAAFYLFARNHDPARFATLGATFIALGTLGNIAGSAPLAAAVAAWGWRPSAIALAGFTVAVGIAVYVFVRDPQSVRRGEGEDRDGYLTMLSIRALWPIFPAILLGYAVAAGIRGLWVTPFLQDVHGLGALDAGRVTLYMAIALSLGSLAYGPLDRLFDSRKKVVFGGNLIVLAGCAALAAMPQMPLASAALLLTAIGFFGASYAVQLAHGKAFMPPHLIGRGVTLMNFFSIGGVGAMQYLTGMVVEAGDVAGEPAVAYGALFAFYSVTLALALAAYAFSRDARPSQG